MRACSTSHLFHYFFSAGAETRDAVLREGLRPLSDFPEGERWRQIEADMPDFYPSLYGMIGEPVLGRPYENSGVFVTPVDFRLVPGEFLSDKPRFRIPIERVDPAQAVITHVRGDERVNLPFSEANLKAIADVWDVDMIHEWFGRDQTKVFFHVPQVAVYQGRIEVMEDDFEGV